MFDLEANPLVDLDVDVDVERRFGGLSRLYGQTGAQSIRDAHVVVVGVGGVGSWAVEALARSGVGQLTLIDMDHVSESNINRQIHALGSTLGQSKIEAMRQRVRDIHPHCKVNLVDDFVTPANVDSVLSSAVAWGSGAMAVLDACDQVRAKVAMAAWARAKGCRLVAVGAAGGKRLAQAVEVADLSAVTHDRLLAQVRHGMRKHHGAARSGALGVVCVFSREPVSLPGSVCDTAAEPSDSTESDGSLNCHGYGSVVTVTATFGLVAVGALFDALAKSTENSQVSANSQK